jgi:hypothetical protein
MSGRHRDVPKRPCARTGSPARDGMSWRTSRDTQEPENGGDTRAKPQAEPDRRKRNAPWKCLSGVRRTPQNVRCRFVTPVPTDTRADLVAHDIDSTVIELFDRGEAAETRTDHTHRKFSRLRVSRRHRLSTIGVSRGLIRSIELFWTLLTSVDTACSSIPSAG